MTLDGNGTLAARVSLRFRLLLALLDDFVLVTMRGGGGNADGAGSSGVAGIGVGSIHSSSSSSRSAKSDEIVRKNPTTVVVLCEIGWVVRAAVVLGVVGPTGSSPVPPPSDCFLMRRTRIDHR